MRDSKMASWVDHDIKRKVHAMLPCMHDELMLFVYHRRAEELLQEYRETGVELMRDQERTTQAPNTKTAGYVV